MKNLKLILSILILTLTSYYCIGQEYESEEKSVTGIYEIPETNKSVLFASINKWISINYNSAKNVIQLNDKESGTIIIKGINEVIYKNTMKTLYPKNKYIQDYSTIKFNHLIEINIKDNKYRIIYRIIDIASEDTGSNNIVFKCVNLNGTKEESIIEYNQFIDNLLKKGLIGVKKREKFQSLTKPMFEELNTSLLNDIKQTMKSIKQSVFSKSKNDW